MRRLETLRRRIRILAAIERSMVARSTATETDLDAISDRVNHACDDLAIAKFETIIQKGKVAQ